MCDDFLSHARTKLEDDLARLTKLAEAAAGIEGASHEVEADEASMEDQGKEPSTPVQSEEAAPEGSNMVGI